MIIKKLKVILIPSKKKRLYAENMSYYFYSYFMDFFGDDISNKLHENTLKPISIFTYKNMNNDEYVVNINITADEHFCNEIANKILSIESYDINALNESFKVKEKIMYSSITEDEYAKKYLYSINDRNLRQINILTTTTFKQGDEYALFPEIHLILNSAINKWNNFSEKYQITDKQVIEEINNSCKIISYDLKTSTYIIKGSRIDGFKGTIRIAINSNNTIKGLIFMILDFLNYSGIGIKTALGMGGVKVE